MTDLSKAYKYNEATKEFEEMVDCQVDPKATATYGRTIYLLPAHSTYQEPLIAKEGFAVKFDGEKWVYEAVPPVPEPAEPTEEELKHAEISELKCKLADSDYAIIKIAEGVAEREEYADLIAQRAEWRARINELEEE